MIYCLNCGVANREGSRFCNGCGSPLGASVRCTQCGLLNSPTVRFCGQCGGPLQPAAPTAPSHPRLAGLPAPVLPPSEEEDELPLEFDAPSIAELLAEPSPARATPAHAAQPAVDSPAEPDAVAVVETSSPPAVAAPATAPAFGAAAPLPSSAMPADLAPHEENAGDGTRAGLAALMADAREALDSTWFDRWPASLEVSEAPPEEEMPQPPPLAVPHPAHGAVSQSALPIASPSATVAPPPEDLPGWMVDAQRAASVAVPSVVAAVASLNVPAISTSAQMSVGAPAAGIALARSVPAGLSARAAFAPPASACPAEAVALFTKVVAGLPVLVAAAAQERRRPAEPKRGAAGRRLRRLLIVLVLLLVVAVAVLLAVKTGRLPLDALLLPIKLR